MGMFDYIKVKRPLPLTEELSSFKLDWKEESFQTKDLDNLLDLYEINDAGRLMHLAQKRDWKEDPSSPLGGYMDIVSEQWEDINFHGVIRFYTSYCDEPTLDYDGIKDVNAMSWADVVTTEGYDYWIDFLAIFDTGTLKEIRLERVEKTPIRVRLANNKSWSEKRAFENNLPFNKMIGKLRKFPTYRNLTRGLSRLEQRCHETLSKAIRKIS